jgi:arylformamidase
MISYRWLSFPLDVNDPRPPAIPSPELTELYTVERDGASVHTLKVASHTGTHVDTPRHVIANGFSLADFTPQDLIFTNPRVIDLPLSKAVIITPDHLEPYRSTLTQCDMAVFRFGYGRFRVEDPVPFCTDCPGFGIEAAGWLVRHCPNMKAMGMDVPSLACIKYLDKTMAAHNILLEGIGRKFLIIEDMNLSGDLSGLTQVRINPWLINGMDSGPCSVIGVFEK